MNSKTLLTLAVVVLATVLAATIYSIPGPERIQAPNAITQFD